MLPKEHGAYGQLAFPAVTALGVVGLAMPAVLTALAAAAAFLGHEPLLVLAGRRGPRARRETGAVASRWLALTSAVALAAGLAAVRLAPPSSRWAFLVPVVPLAAVVWAFVTHREKTTAGEGSVAVTFASVAFPMCLSAGAPLPAALAIAMAFAALFLAGTLAVRVVILSVRGGGDPRAVRATRLLFLLNAGSWCAALAAMGGRVLPWATLAAIAPGVLVAAVVAALPPSPARLRTLGWTLVLASAAASVTLVAALRWA